MFFGLFDFGSIASYASSFVSNGASNTSGSLTQESFLRQLGALKGNGWKVDWHGCIRDKDGRCPLVAIAQAKGLISATLRTDFTSAVVAMGYEMHDNVTHNTIQAVVPSADGKRSDLRAQMLAVLGLEEREVSMYNDFSYDALKAAMDAQDAKTKALIASQVSALQHAIAQQSYFYDIRKSTGYGLIHSMFDDPVVSISDLTPA